MTPERFKLQPQDRTNPLWLRLEKHMQQVLAEQRALNDATRPMDKTEHIRGRIAQLKELLALGDDPRPPIT